MLTLKSMSWDNCFSYGDNNKLDFDKNTLTQLVGVNGAGKTSISLMIQEVLYGKNNKNIRKQDIANNKSNKKGYQIKLEFEKDNDIYRVELDRKANLKFKLFKNNEDISSHTSLNTYKTLSEIIGVADFKVFCQLIYQHSTDSLDFLTATDTNRKKFLISLLQLDRYLELHEHFKEKTRLINNDITKLNGSITTIEAWIDKHKNMDFDKKQLVTVENYPERHITRENELVKDIANINSINKKIFTNNQYKTSLNNLNDKYYMGSAPPLPSISSVELRAQIRVLESKLSYHQDKINQLNKTVGECPTCLQVVNEEERLTMLSIETNFKEDIVTEIQELKKAEPQARHIEQEIEKYIKEKKEFERLSQLIDYSLPNITLDLNELQEELSEVRGYIIEVQKRRKIAQEENLAISGHNSKIDVVKNQLKDMQNDLKEKNITLIEKENLMNILELLKKTFSTNGLVSYKIESSVKELEKRINKYLAELTHFQIYFKLNGEKLNIDVVDDMGNITSISNLSSGERARVNIATILAIRNILSSLTSSKINFLMLDEVIGVIDSEGKEKLSEILLKENLNTFIVSHDWTHPLIPRINIVKEGHISRIEND